MPRETFVEDERATIAFWSDALDLRAQPHVEVDRWAGVRRVLVDRHLDHELAQQRARTSARDTSDRALAVRKGNFRDLHGGRRSDRALQVDPGNLVARAAVERRKLHGDV